MNPGLEPHDELWQLLGKARRPEPSPFFARNVLRAVREEQASARLGGKSWWPRRAWSAAALSGACAAGILCWFQLSQRTATEHAPLARGVAQQIVATPDYEVITHLDELAANEESSLWLDDSIN